MAQAMGVAPKALRDIRVESAREALEVLFRMEEEIGLYPVENDGAMGHAIDSEKALAPATHQSLVAWKRMRDGLSDGSVSSEEYEVCKASSFRG
ncbi:XRE family transcriptional regulator [Ellagibacter isourolithinifaciens]|uniref:XRE family transcriptional regulator n=1 Tax=Ellagibacter isourolithinifaciens TaxID=2137581 RepID=UPI0013013B5B|nr:XRE family transcriptional regulator [Ellagibacter isourolithinifaciens]